MEFVVGWATPPFDFCIDQIMDRLQFSIGNVGIGFWRKGIRHGLDHLRGAVAQTMSLRPDCFSTNNVQLGQVFAGKAD